MQNSYMKPMPHAFRYAPMSLEKRREILPEKNVNSLYPAKFDVDAFGTYAALAERQYLLYIPIAVRNHQTR